MILMGIDHFPFVLDHVDAVFYVYRLQRGAWETPESAMVFGLQCADGSDLFCHGEPVKASIYSGPLVALKDYPVVDAGQSITVRSNVPDGRFFAAVEIERAGPHCRKGALVHQGGSFVSGEEVVPAVVIWAGPSPTDAANALLDYLESVTVEEDLESVTVEEE